MNAPGTVLVVGGTGRTGRHVVRKLLERGYPARVLTRNPARAENRLGDGVGVFGGHVTDAESVWAATENAGAVVVIVESSNFDDAPNSPERAHYGGALNVVSAAAARSTHVVLVSQIYITRPETYPEVRNVIHWRGRGEEVVRGSGLPYTVVRPGWLTSDPGGRQSVRLEQGDTGEGRVPREDVAEVCVAALTREEARGKTFEVYGEPGPPPSDWGAAFASLSPDRPKWFRAEMGL